MLMYSQPQKTACLEHSNLLKVNGRKHEPPRCPRFRGTRPARFSLSLLLETKTRLMAGALPGTKHEACAPRDQTHHARNPTTSFLTAANLIYAIGAGITAAAGPCYRPGWRYFRGWFSSFDSRKNQRTCTALGKERSLLALQHSFRSGSGLYLKLAPIRL